jgi:predicted phage gp36 major capsid-like protein
VSVLAVATAFVICSLWILDQLEVVPTGRVKAYLTRLAMLVVVVAMFVAPTAYRNGVAWFIDRRTDEILERVQPVLDELAPPSTSVASVAADHRS